MRIAVLASLLLSTLLAGGLLTAGLVPPGAPIPPPGTGGSPSRPLSPAEEVRFRRGRELFDKDFGRTEGVGPHFNGDSCRACHQNPVVGGAGGIDVQVQRPAGSPPETGGLAQTHSLFDVDREEIPADVEFVEERNSPTLLGLGLVNGISEATILAGEDPDDDDGDKIRGFAHILSDGAVGRFGWKAQVPDLRSFLRDALSNEMGITVPATANLFGDTSDGDDVSDPELSQPDLEEILFFLRLLDFAAKRPATQAAVDGEALFMTIGCAKCHTPVLGGVELYSNLLLHDVLTPPVGQGPPFEGVTQGLATSGLYRTSPLRGLSDTAPYFHDGRSETIGDAIERHTGEAVDVAAAYAGLSDDDKAALIAFLLRL